MTTEEMKADIEFTQRVRAENRHQDATGKVVKLVEWIESNQEDDIPPDDFEDCITEHENIYKWFNSLESSTADISQLFFTTMTNASNGRYNVYKATGFFGGEDASVGIDRCILIVPDGEGEMYIIPESLYSDIPDVPDWTVEELEAECEAEDANACNETLSEYDLLPSADQLNRETGLGDAK